MQKNEIVRLHIEEINNLGCGVGHLQNTDGSRAQVVFVRDAVTGDVLDARIIKVTKSYLVGKIERLLVPSPMRCRSDCSAKGCGGCVYRHIQYACELEEKRAYVQSAFRKAGLGDVSVLPVAHTGQLTGYRNKAQYPVGTVGGKMQAGFYATGTHRIVPAEECLLQPKLFSELTAFLCSFLQQHGVTPYEEETGKGLLRHLYLREGKLTGEVMVCLVLNGEALPCESELVQAVREHFPQVVHLSVNVNRENTNVVLGKKSRLLYGKENIEDIMCGLRFSVSAHAFYQVNHDACELLYGIAKERAALTGNETLIDLYCGIGTIGLSMADRAKEVVGIEIVPEAVQCAKENAKRNEISNASFYCGDASNAEAFLHSAEQKHGVFENVTVVMDPPRKGSTKELIRTLAKRDYRRVVYISCNPDTLARDCAVFRELGYTVGEVQPVDLFPRTGHVETVCLLSKLQNRQHIEIELNMDELDVTNAEKKATYPEIKEYVMEHYGYKIPSLYIARVKRYYMKIQYENLTIRQAEVADAKQLTAWWNDGAVMAHAGFPNGLGTTEEEVIEGLENGRMVIEESNRLIGECVYRSVADGAAEIGIKICETDCQNRGVGRKVLSMLISWLFQNGYFKIVLDTDLTNARAQHVYESLGFRKVRTNIDSWKDQLGQLRSSVDYELVETDFNSYI